MRTLESDCLPFSRLFWEGVGRAGLFQSFRVADAPHEGGIARDGLLKPKNQTPSSLVDLRIFCYSSCVHNLTPRPVPEIQTQTIFPLCVIIDGHIVSGAVSYCPAPPAGVLSEVARLEAELLLVHTIRQDIASGRLPQLGADDPLTT